MTIAHQRLVNQRLANNPFETVLEAVEWLGAVQAQDYPGAKWGIGQRVAETTDAEIDRLLDDGALIRTHVLRPTWHVVLAKDVRWMLELSGDRVLRASRSRQRQLGLDDELLERCAALIARELRDGHHSTRNELGALLQANGIATTDNRLAHMLGYCELTAVICSGPLRGRAMTYALLDERVPATTRRTREEMLAEIARRYFQSHAPATAHDFAWWSGLRMGDAREGIALLGEELAQFAYDGVTYHALAGSRPSGRLPRFVHLLPNYDEHIVAYSDHGPSLDPTIDWTKHIMADRLAPHVIAVNGLAVGNWRRVVGKGEITVELHLQRDLTKAEERPLERAAEEYARFLGMPVGITVGGE